jgi:hypothetical protein
MCIANQSDSIDEELVCIDSLLHHLKENLGYLDVLVEREQNDPPDFWVTVSGQKFAAEVTSIVNDQAYIGLCENLESAVFDASKSNNYLNGKYALIFARRPDIAKRGSKRWKTVVSTATEFVATTQHLSSSDEHLIHEDDDGKLSIKKISNIGATIGRFGPMIFKWEGEAEAELLYLIQEAILKKRSSLQKGKVQNQCSGIILLFYDAYGFCDISDVHRLLQESSGYEWFHSVFWAASFTDRPNNLSPDTPGRVGAFLHSKNPEWCRSKR